MIYKKKATPTRYLTDVTFALAVKSGFTSTIIEDYNIPHSGAVLVQKCICARQNTLRIRKFLVKLCSVFSSKWTYHVIYCLYWRMVNFELIVDQMIRPSISFDLNLLSGRRELSNPCLKSSRPTFATLRHWLSASSTTLRVGPIMFQPVLSRSTDFCFRHRNRRNPLILRVGVSLISMQTDSLDIAISDLQSLSAFHGVHRTSRSKRLYGMPTDYLA